MKSKLVSLSKSSLPIITILTLIIFILFTTRRYSTAAISANQRNRNANFENLFLSSASNYTLAAYLRHLTLHPHLAGTPPALETAHYVRSHFESLGLDAHATSHAVLLSYPTHSSLATHFTNGSVTDHPLSERGASEARVVIPYHAYSPSGSVLARPVFLNYGRDKDYAELESSGVDVRGCIGVIRRGGALSRNAAVEKAAARGVAAVVMYSEGEKFRGGVERGTVLKGIGDPLSPGWSGDDGGEKLRLGDPRVTERFPSVPSMPVSADTAAIILGSLEGAPVPKEWRDSLKRGGNIFGRVGPGPHFLNFTYTGEKKVATIHNIFAVIRGFEEPDRYIVMGNHRDAWTFGAVDPNSGTSALLDVARRFALLMRLGWTPRRSIILGSWDAEEFGMDGPEFFVGATPQLDDLLIRVMKKVNDPDSDNMSIYERSTLSNKRINMQRLTGADSDFAPFLQHAGVPSTDMYYGKDSPVYHTAFDSYEWMVNFGDPFFHRHVAVSSVWGLLALHLADDSILPFNYLSYVAQLQEYVERISPAIEGNVLLQPIILAIQDLQAAATDIAEESKKLLVDENKDANFALKTRMLNDRLMMAERGFLDTEGPCGSQCFKHLVYGPGESNLDFFPRVGDAISRSEWMEEEERREAIQHEVWRVGRAIQRAASLLKGDLT